MDDNHLRTGTRLAAIAGGGLLLVGAISLWFTADDGNGRAGLATPARAESTPTPVQEASAGEPMLDVPEQPAPKSREEKRFARSDRNDDGLVQQGEFLHQRRRNFDKLDVNGDGRMSFDEYAAEGIKKFDGADADGNRLLSAAEYASTAPRPRTPGAAASRQCPPCALAQAGD